MDQQETNRQEWNNPSNWRWLVYHSEKDSRLCVPKRISALGWTMNLANPRATTWLAMLGLMPCLVTMLLAIIGGWAVLSTSPGPWLWLAGSREPTHRSCIYR